MRTRTLLGRLIIIGVAAVPLATRTGSAQQAPMFPNPPITFDGRGVTVYSTDSVSRLTFRFRVQELFTGTTESESDFSLARTQLMIRRMWARLALLHARRSPAVKGATPEMATTDSPTPDDSSCCHSVHSPTVVTMSRVISRVNRGQSCHLPWPRREMIAPGVPVDNSAPGCSSPAA